MYWFKRKWRQVKRVVDFLPIIWKGYDWDYQYAIELFQHQLKRMADHIGSNKAWGMEHKQTASRIRTAVELMEKVYDEEYAFEYMKQMEEKYGKSSFEFEELDELNKNGDPYYTMVEKWEEDYTESDIKLIDGEKNTLMRESRAKQARAHKILWRYIEHNIQHWWD
jgi:hypothetical protein